MNSPSNTKVRIRVALVITELNVGGAERCLTNLALGLDHQRFDVEVYSLGPRPSPPHADLADRLAEGGIETHFLGLSSAWQAATGVRILRRALRRQAPHVLQSFLFHANVLGSWALGSHPSTQMVAGIRVADPRKPRMVLERLALRRAAKVVCVSQSVAEFAKRQVGLPSAQLVVIPNGIEPQNEAGDADVALGEFQIGPDDPVLLYVGRLDRQKGLDWLLESSDSILASLPNHHLLLVGDGPERTALATAAAQCECHRRIHFAGWRPDIPQLLRRCQMLVLPSRWEGMPNAVLEAMASGRPVVATRADGVEELLGTAADGQIVDFGDQRQLVEAIHRLAADPHRREQLGTSNRARAEAEFSMAAMVRRYEELYLEVAGG